MSLLSRWEAPIVIPTGGYSFTLDETGVGTQAVTLTAGQSYYWSEEEGGDEGVTDPSGFGFAEYLEDELATASPGSSVYTVSVSSTADSATGVLTISSNGVDFRLTSVSADLLALMGFTSAAIGAYANPHTGSKAVKAMWLPDCPPNALYGLNSAGKPESQAVPMIAPDGTSSFFHGSSMTRNRVWYEMVTKARTIAAEESTANESYQQFWLDAIRGEAGWSSASRSLRFYPDRGSLTQMGDFHVTQVGMPDYDRAAEDNDLYYRVSLDLVEG